MIIWDKRHAEADKLAVYYNPFNERKELHFKNHWGIFEVTGKFGNYKIIRIEPWYRTDATLDYGLPLGDEIEPFPNLTQAWIFIKNNFENIR